MQTEAEIIKEVQRSLEYEARVNLHRNPIRVDVTEGAVILEGEVESVAAKKLALERAGAVDGIRGVLDRLRVAPAERRGDGAMRDSLSGFLLREAELQNCTIRTRTRDSRETLHDAGGEATGDFEIAIEDGVISFEGSVISLSHKRLLGVLAWWTPGCRDVINALDVRPPEEDNDAEVVDALRLVLEVDPLVHADQIAARCRNYVVTLGGRVRTEQERRQVELDAFALFGVNDVVNRIEVGAE